MPTISIETRIDIKTLASVLLHFRQHGLPIMSKSALVRLAVESCASTNGRSVTDDERAFDLLIDAGILSSSRKVSKSTILSVSAEKDTQYDPRFLEAAKKGLTDE